MSTSKVLHITLKQMRGQFVWVSYGLPRRCLFWRRVISGDIDLCDKTLVGRIEEVTDFGVGTFDFFSTTDAMNDFSCMRRIIRIDGFG